MAFDFDGASLDELDIEGSKKLPPALYTFDFETDPFKEWMDPLEQRIPKVFAVGIYCITSGVYDHHWGRGNTREECQEDCINFLLTCFDAAPKGAMFYAHNGGKFDFHYFKEHFRGPLKIIGARIAECIVGHVVIRDSFTMLPVALSKFGGKVDIDYSLMEWDVREQHRAEILHYMEEDCRVLAKAITRFIREFGLHLTMAGAAMKQLKKFHEFERMASEVTDKTFRDFYYGGRVECIETGILKGAWKLYDVNGMYPSVMRDFQHPVSKDFTTYIGPYATAILPRCDFAEIQADNRGCLPSVMEDGKLTFRRPSGIFHATGHEIRAGLETGTIDIKRVIRAYKAEAHSAFDKFINHFTQKRYDAKAALDALLDLFYKLVQNSSYGKFAQNPSKFKDWEMTEEVKETSDGWVLEHTFPDAKTFIWSRASVTPTHLMRFNVATAASITGAARAMLWRGLCAAQRPIYCDTDSMMCENAIGLDIDDKRLGAWKLEAEAATVAIGGRKMYAMLDAQGETVKKASKGVRISSEQIVKVAGGGKVTHRNAAPTYSLTRPTRFIHREVKRTR